MAKSAPTVEIERLAARLEPELAKALLQGLQALGAGVDLEAVAAALARGDVASVMAALNIDPAHAFLRVQPAIQGGAYAAGALAASSLRLTGARFVFDQLNPRLISWLQTYSLGLIREITDSTKDAIRGALVTGMQAGKNPRTVAQQIKGMVGLTERQAMAVQNYRKELETFHQRKTGGGYRVGDKIDRVNGFQVLRPNADGTPMDGITERRLRDFRFDGQLANAMDTKKPLTEKQIDKMVDAYERKFLAYRARTIARTEALRTTNAGVQDAWRQAVEKGAVEEQLVRRQWKVAKDERLCKVCAPIPGLNNKRGVKFGQPFATPIGPVTLPPIHPNCLTGDTLVTPGSRVAATSKRPYSGEVCVIRTEAGEELTITPNHPLLTRRGWVPAGAVQQGDHLARRIVPKGRARVAKNHHGVPSSISEMHEAARRSLGVASAVVPSSPMDFHGDGKDGEVHVVSADRLLRLRRFAKETKHRAKAALIVASDCVAVALSALRPSGEARFGANASANCVMCRGDLGGSLTLGHSGPLHRFRRALAAQHDLAALQEARDSGAADAELAREFADGTARGVEPDEVVCVTRRPFSGHVFNLETENGHYFASGLLVHNCRCTVFLRLFEPSQLVGG